MSIQWQDLGVVQRTEDGMYEVEEGGPGQWRGIDNHAREQSDLMDLHLALAWCEDRIAARAIGLQLAGEDCQPDFVVIEGVDGVREVIRKADAPTF